MTTKIFKKNIQKKIYSYKTYDNETNINVEYIVDLFEKQNGECLLCGGMMKTNHHGTNDDKQISIDRIK